MLDRAAARTIIDVALGAAMMMTAGLVGCTSMASRAPALVPGTLDVHWMHGSARCEDNTDPELQIHAYNATTYILRQNKCLTFEAPFVYVLIGEASALSLDTGATDTPALRDAIRRLVGDKPLVAAHSHGHGDHRASDGRFAASPGVTVVANTVEGQQAAFAIAAWPEALGHADLGGRPLDVIALPGHQATHIAIYDRQTGLLLTGDSLYPGLLFVHDWAEFRASIHRLTGFAQARPIAHILGAHIEMTSTPKQVYPYGSTFQPAEHALALALAQLRELDAALIRIGPVMPTAPEVHDDFIIYPANP
jgi:glyoxylase-like metal-dependent hydrolase (beta-lactamase superfamily II)